MSWFLAKDERERIEILSDLLRLERFASSNKIVWSRMGRSYNLNAATIKSIVQNAFEISQMTVDKLFMHNSWQEIQEKIEQWVYELKKITGIHFARCITSETLTAKSRSKLTASLENVLKGSTHVQCIVEPSIVGGIIIELDGVKFDSSYATMLNDLEEKFTEYMLLEDANE